MLCACSQVPDSKLDPRVRQLVEMICDMNMMQAAMVEIGFDARKMPLGKLSKRTIELGYDTLKQIAALLDRGASRQQLAELSGQFYTVRLPHSASELPPHVPCTRDELVLCAWGRSFPTTLASSTRPTSSWTRWRRFATSSRWWSHLVTLKSPPSSWAPARRSTSTPPTCTTATCSAWRVAALLQCGAVAERVGV
jgi:hypothetical protein